MSESSSLLNRRRVLQGAGAVAVVATGRAAGAAPSTAPAPAAAAAPAPSGPSLRLSRDPYLHVARRLTFGATPKLIADMHGVGIDAWIEQQLNPAAIDDSELDLYLAAGKWRDIRTPIFNLDLGALQAAQGRTLVRQLFSNKHLYEVVVEFWANHFSIFGGHLLAGSYKGVDDDAVARAHTFGSFTDMLLTSAKSPAMLFYLDQWLSTGDNPNENYAREVMELHTLGVDGGYTERDMAQAALALTGWTANPGSDEFVYRPEIHYVGPLKVMGWRHANPTPEGGVAVAESLLRYLAAHPSTARHLATKLCRRFVSDTPPKSLVDSAAKVYLASGTQIAPVLRHIFASRAFRSSVGAKYRRPMEMVGASVRALGLKIEMLQVFDQGTGLYPHLETLGQAPFNWPPPDGYPDVAEEWLSTAANLARWNFLQALVAGQVGGLGAPDYAALLGTPTPATAGELVDRMFLTLTYQFPVEEHRQALLRYLGRYDDAPVDANEVQAESPALAALVLSSPYLQAR